MYHKLQWQIQHQHTYVKSNYYMYPATKITPTVMTYNRLVNTTPPEIKTMAAYRCIIHVILCNGEYRRHGENHKYEQSPENTVDIKRPA